jgi:CheY-like chemotaxis protein
MDHERHMVLYIEDNAANARLVERILQRRPEVELITTRSGLSGVELARARQPTIVLLDLGLPDIDGAEVLARLRADPLTRMLAVVILSADKFDHQIQRMLEAGAVGYLTKPLDVQRLLETIDDIIDEHASRPR